MNASNSYMLVKKKERFMYEKTISPFSKKLTFWMSKVSEFCLWGHITLKKFNYKL